MTFGIEKWFWENIRTVEGPASDLLSPREAIALMMKAGTIRSEKQAWATLFKWSDRGWYDYGVNLELGWRLDIPFPRVPLNPPWYARPGVLLAPEDA